MRLLLTLSLWCLTAATGGAEARPARLLLVVKGAPKSGLVVSRVDLRAAAKAAGLSGPIGIAASLTSGESVPAQFVPDPDSARMGTVVLRLPRAGSFAVRMSVQVGRLATRVTGPETVAMGAGPKPGVTVQLDPAHMAGFPFAFDFGDGKRFDTFAWNDRVYSPDRGSFSLRNDRKGTLERVSDGAVCAVYRVQARYCAEDGKQPPSLPDAIYDWYVFKQSPLVYVSALARQKTPAAWSEIHLLELNFTGRDFTHWAGGNPVQQGELTATKKSTRFADWGVLVEGRNAIGMFGAPVTLYDGRGEYGTYLHSTWTSWNDTEKRLSAWLWIGEGPEPAAAVRAAAKEDAAMPQVALTTPELHARIAGLRGAAERLRGDDRLSALWHAALAEQAEQAGRLDDSAKLASGTVPAGLHLLRAGSLGLALEGAGGGVHARSLLDLGAAQELLAAKSVPLFSISLRNPANKDEAAIGADTGWSRATVESRGAATTIRWSHPNDPRLAGLVVTARVQPDSAASALRWSLEIRNPGSSWSVWRVVFPQVAVADLGKTGAVLYPAGPGVLKEDPWRNPVAYHGNYPGGWCAMQLLAAYRPGPKPTGLYLGMHDPWGSVKDILAESDGSDRSLRLAYSQPAESMGVPGNGFALSGQAEWRLLRGDWFDAATIYRNWARRNAKWWPKLTADGRPDTPLWMRQLSAWAQIGGGPAEVVAPVKRFAEFLGAPVGLHWYSWHQIPFDNDYPHYFPTKPGVAEGVSELERAGVKVMPYINGRLWDTHDRGSADWEFTSKALPAATKDDAGKPYIETYGSKESDGSPVRLAVMCPATPLWQQTQRDIVLRLMNEVGVNGVYMDQIAAAPPALCLDRSHGHPLGGGHWWNEGYWRLVGAIRATMPKDRMLTTECNGEPFVNVFDGYLTWHWQMDGMVPVFPAVYGGVVQMFGRAYGGGKTRDLALRTKAGQQLCFGEQIGWMDPHVVDEPQNAEFLKRAISLRRRLARYFYAGEMARPPRLTGPVPRSTADWQWYGETLVTTDQVLTAAWRIPGEGRAALLFVNVGDTPVQSTVGLDPRVYGLAADVTLSEVGSAQSARLHGRTRHPLAIPAHGCVALELKGASIRER